MASGERYRGYNIYAQGDEFIATCASGEEIEEFVGSSVESLMTAIDALWKTLSGVESLRTGPDLPSWYSDAIEAGRWQIRVPHAATPGRDLVPASEIQALAYAMTALADENGAVETELFRKTLEGFWSKHVTDDVRFRYEWNGQCFTIDAVPMTEQSLHFVVKDVVLPDGRRLQPRPVE
ncbi:hypothetical protein DA075_06590 [Methylobacterium currus]|uniref:Uncharacterized protein n=1 Tax=Methylobacterium currus TaxID=2051553 RepID=A0A2R4WGH3_9HYPH|nr:hypothetical protein [Methylobacterium currus]AWB20631.1 hypothetical protein DA075_06590 [Methylobacterium currus]